MAFYISTLALAAAFIIACVMNLVRQLELTDELLGALVLLVLSGVVFAGFAAAFAIRFVLWRQIRAYEKNPRR
jgi:ABC-type enterochelin transport system permease subunit